VAPRYAFLSDGRIQVESKNQMRARGLPSTDFADALNLTFAQAGLMTSSTNAAWMFDSAPVMGAIPGTE
jgi:hypothetical protein